MNPEEKFTSQFTDPKHGDVSPHLLTLRYYASCCDSIAEFGVDDGSTSLAFILGRPRVIYAYDLWRQPEIDQIEAWAKELGVEYVYHSGEGADSRRVVLPDMVDLIYIDTDHSAETTLAELERHAHMAKRWIMLHDIDACGINAPNLADYEGEWVPPGLWAGAIGPFMRSYEGRRWTISWIEHSHTGLLCLNRLNER